MRHQDRHRAVFQHVTRGATEQGFAQAGMAVSPHDQQIGGLIDKMPKQHIGDSWHCFGKHGDIGVNAVARKHLAQHPAGIGPFWRMDTGVDQIGRAHV